MQLFLFFNWRKYFVDFNFRSWYKINMDRSDDKMPTTMFYYRKWYHDIKTTLSKSGWNILASYCSVQNHVDRTARCVYINAREYRSVNKKWTIQRNRQQDEDKQTKQKHNTIYVGHHYAQTNILWSTQWWYLNDLKIDWYT